MAQKTGPIIAKARAPLVHKTRVFEAIDAASRSPETLQRALDALRSGRDLLDVGAASGTVEGDAERREHLDAHWLGDEADRAVLRDALCRAAELCVEYGIPADCYWVFAGSERSVSVSRSAEQVTVLVVTPHPDIETEGEAPCHPSIEIFRRAAKG